MNSIAILIAFLLAAAIDLAVAVAILRSRETEARSLSAALLGATFVTLFYIGSVYSKTYLTMSVLSSLYFVCVDVSLLGFAHFLLTISNLKNMRAVVVLKWLVCLYFIVDAAMMLLSPFMGEFALSYTVVDAVHGIYEYNSLLPFNLHLFYCYVLVAGSILMLVYQIASVPSLYRNRYIGYLLGFGIIIAMNAVYLFVPASVLAYYDMSILMYSVLGVFIYWVHFHYAVDILKSRAGNLALNQLGSAALLFDYQGNLVSANEEASFLIPEEERNSKTTMKQFMETWGLDEFVKDTSEEKTFVWASSKNGQAFSYRTLYRIGTDKKGEINAYIFIFTDNSLEIDLLTGFATQATAAKAIGSTSGSFTRPCTVALFNVDNISDINQEYGQGIGDQAIKLLAQTMRDVFPADTFFCRHAAAKLIAFTPKTTTFTARNYAFEVTERLKNQTQCPASLTVLACVEESHTKNEPIASAVRNVLTGLHSHELVIQNSARTSLISSLVQMQRNSETNIDEHIERTRSMCRLLGVRMGLSDTDLNNLELLCMLHNIGNVGIPLDILNKPGRLTEVERDIFQSHVKKGYEIARSSKELSCIAEAILHHHERWDGDGYPSGLSHETIPLLSRLLQVVNTFDVKTHNRPYRPAIPVSAAKAELRDGAGSEFDPTVVAEFLALLDDYPKMLSSEWLSNGDDRSASDHTPGVMTYPADALSSDDLSDLFFDFDNEEDESTPELSVLEYAQYQLDSNQRIVEINDAFTRMTGYTVQDLEQYELTQDDLIPVDYRHDYWNIVSDTSDVSNIVMIEHPLLTKSLDTIHVVCFGRMYYDTVNQTERSEIIAADLRHTNLAMSLVKEVQERNERAQQMMKTSCARTAPAF